MKRIFALLLAALLLLGAGCAAKQNPAPDAAAPSPTPAGTPPTPENTPAPAATAEPAADAGSNGMENLGYFTLTPTDGAVEAPMMGLRLPLSGALLENQDRLTADVWVDPESASLYLSLVNPDPTDESPEVYPFLQIDGYTSRQIREGSAFRYVGTNNTLHYYFMDYAEAFDMVSDFYDEMTGTMSPEVREIYDALLKDTSRLGDELEILPLTLPQAAESEDLGPKLMAAKLSDLNGNEVALGELISANKVTLINIWGTFCGPCIQEMPDLAQLAETYAGKGFGVVGLTCDILDGQGNIQAEIVEDAWDIMEAAGVEYPVLILSRTLEEATELMYVPTSYLVDSSGNILEGPLTGSASASVWEEMITGYLD